MRLSKVIVAFLLIFLFSEVKAYGCTVSLTPMAFGFYDYLQSDLDGQGLVDVNCPGAMPYVISIDAGLNSAGSFAPRLLKVVAGATTMNYNVFTDASRTNVWGDGTGVTVTQSGTGMGASQLYPAYGRVPTGQNVGAGVYEDSLTVTVTY